MVQETCSLLSSSIQTWCFDVFVSFNGKDTRLSFTDHLFAALNRREINTFRDDRKLKRGKDIWTGLEKAIETSRIAVIVFSRNYASSSWCLNELAKIMECKQKLQQTVLPIFYDVNPSEVRSQKGSLAEVFAKHKECFEEDKVARWKAALTEAASLSGWDLQNVAHRFESEFIEKIIGYISDKLNPAFFMVSHYPVGIESRMQELNKLLSRDSSDVCMVGIWGIGGIGKTTIAQAIYDLLQRKFEESCFLQNVREISKKPNGLIDLQEQILSSFHVNNNRKIKLVDQGTMLIKKRAWCRRVLIVLDDVDHRDQLDQLAIRRDYFQPGSIIIITTRNESMLKLAKVDKIYTPPALDYQESLQLLSWHAFGKDHPNENYAELSKEVIYYAGGLPLALNVLGSLLFDKSMDEWEGILEKLRVIPHDEILQNLIVSFYSLSDTQKELFLDIACFFVGMEKNYIFKILQDSNLFLESELGVLVRLCLVTIDCSNQLRMHDMIRDMGREVVRRESPKVPGKRTRLWFHEDVLDVLKHHKGTEVLEGIMLNLQGVSNLHVDFRAFAKMDQLRVLQLNYVRLNGNFQCPSKRLRYLEWYGFPLDSIPADLYMENLVTMYMPYSSLIELWKGTKILKNLKFLDVSHSYHLRRTPDFSGLTNLEVLVLNNCTSLVDVHKSVICLHKLVTLDLADCRNLRKLPLGIYKLKSHVNLSGCTNLDMVPRFESKSPLTLRYSLLISSEVPMGSCGFIDKLVQHKDFTIDSRSLSTGNDIIIAPFCMPVIFNFLNQLTVLDLSLCRRFQSLDELPIGLQVMDANNTTSFEWILTGSNWKLSKQLISFGCTKLLKNSNSKPRKKLLKELIATDSFSVFLPGAEFPDWFDYKSTGSILSFVVPPIAKQKIQGWFLCAEFASRFHDIHGFTVFCEFKNNTKGIKWYYQQKNCRVIPCLKHMWLYSAPLHHMTHMLEAKDKVEYSIHITGGFQLKKFGVNLIYENDKNDYQSYFEAMIENASLPYKYGFLDDVSTNQAMAGDKKIHPSDVQKPRFGDKKKEIATSLDASKWWDEELAARLQDKEDVTMARHCELITTFPTVVPKDHSALSKVEDGPSKQHGWPYFRENPQGTMIFESRAPFEQSMYSSSIPTMSSMSQTEFPRSIEGERMLWEAERQHLHHQLENERRAHQATCFRLHMALAHARQFAPQFCMDLPCPHIESKTASSSQFATASSSPAFTQSMTAAITPVALMRPNTLGLDNVVFLDNPVLGIQSFNGP